MHLKLLFLQLTTITIVIKARSELNGTNIKALNRSTYLPYMLKTPNKKEAEDESNQHVEALDKNEFKDYRFKEKYALNRYEDNKINSILPESNSWKRLTAFLPTHAATTDTQQNLKNVCKTTNLPYNSIFGPFHYVLAQIVFSMIHLGVLSSVLLASFALLNRLFSLSPGPYIKNVNEDLSDQFYKNRL